jgi:hypothetical protein
MYHNVITLSNITVVVVVYYATHKNLLFSKKILSTVQRNITKFVRNAPPLITKIRPSSASHQSYETGKQQK